MTDAEKFKEFFCYIQDCVTFGTLVCGLDQIMFEGKLAIGETTDASLYLINSNSEKFFLRTFPKLIVIVPKTPVVRDVGSISNLGGLTLRGYFFPLEKGAFITHIRALLCLLQNLAEHVPPVRPLLLRLCLSAFYQRVTVYNVKSSNF